jgi:hypothetical protein
MTRLARTPLALAACALFLPAPGCRSRDEFLSRLTVEAPAQITSVSLDRGRGTTTTGNRNRRRRKRTGDAETDIRYRFTVNGRPYDGATEKDGDQTSTYKTGMPAKVCYNPSDPEESEVFSSTHKCVQQ